MSKHLCNNCGHVFTHKKGKLRCPSCLRQNSLEPYDEAKRNKSRSSARDGSSKRLGLFIGVALLLVGGVVGGLALFHKAKPVPPKKGELRVLSDALLVQTLVARKVTASYAVSPFAKSDALSKLVSVKKSDGVKAKVAAVRDAVAKQVGDLRVDPNALSSGEVRTAGELAAALADKHKPERVTSFELAVLTAAALRQAQLLALVAEIYKVKAKTHSADTTGAVGRYVVAVYATDKDLGKKPVEVLDPARAAKMPQWAGGGGDGKMTSIHDGKLEPLDDASVGARLLALRGLALSKKAPKRNSAEAYEMTRLALLGSADAATLHGVRAVVLASAGGVDDAVGEGKKAIALRDDAPRRHLMAQLLLAKRQLGEAQAQLQEAIKKDEGYWPGHGTLATIGWLSGQEDEGNKHLAAARAIAPDEPQVLALAATRMLQDGKNDEGVALLRKAAKIDGSAAVQIKLYLALRQVGKNDEAKALRQRLDKIAESDEQIKEALAAVDRMAAAAGARAGAGAAAGSGAAGAGAGAAGLGAKMPPRPKAFQLPDVKLGTDPSIGGGAGKPGGGSFKLPDVKLGK
ncbi:MAG: hypothetical protein KC503_34100 [Myxococcales bacterium]|nr:hypothetical protein [Myxococcales bacterium]